jgi:hypothetical protein
VLLFLLAILPPAAAKIIYVDANSAGSNTGTSWENAYNHLQHPIRNPHLNQLKFASPQASTNQTQAPKIQPAPATERRRSAPPTA